VGLNAAAYLGRRLWCDRPHFGLTMNFLDNFCTVFVSFIARLNCKIRVPRLLVTVRVFCLLKLRKNAYRLIILGDKNDLFLGRWPSPLIHTSPLSAPTAPRPPLIKILNTPLTEFSLRLQYVWTWDQSWC